ncbi:trimeric intracellular cation channel family protein [Corynebacterium sp. KPL2850]|uniref:trimeric intracellular cation channel family protein n=1 Tax=Corynebacterium sp. KPL2850 TaxID=3158318 RepID=UPI0032EE2F60
MTEVDPLIESLYRWSDVSGVLLMGIIGGTIARKRGYDIIGFFFIAMFSSLGGGMVRDVLINRGTVAAMSEPEYLYLAFTGALIARFVYFKGKTWDYIQAHGDAVVSGLWAGTGAVKAITYGLPPIPCIMMGVFTATGGSMIRDIAMGREPAVFGDNQPTVIPAIACAVIVLVGNHFDMLAVGMIVGPLVSIFLALLGIWAGWRVPANQEWAPINDTAAQVKVLAKKAENKSRAVGRKLEPHRVRSWRHRQMEEALQRRIEKQVRSGKRRQDAAEEASEFLQSFESDVDQLSSVSAESEDMDFGVDFTGDSYEEEQTSSEESQRLLDTILEDDKLTDELIDRLMDRYQSRD